MTVGDRDTANEFMLVYDGFDPSSEALREALTSTGNGYFCIRGAAEWEDASDVHYPGTYAHGVYNRESTIVGGRPVPNEDLVNLPRCLSLKLCIEDEDPIRLSNIELLSYRHTYDVRYALVTRELRFRDCAGRETSLTSRRFVSMGRMHLGSLEWEIVVENWSGRVKVLSVLDGRVLNRGVPRYHQLWGRHLDPEGPRTYGDDVIALKVRTRESRIEIAEAARTRVYRGAQELEVHRSIDQMQDYIQQSLEFEMDQNEPVRVEKIVSLYTSRDRAINEPMSNAEKSVHRYPAFAEALEGHVHTWDELWEVCDVRLPAEKRVQFLLRLHISHLLQVCSRLTPHHDAGVPARGLNGEAYRGHVFWDELYVYPFLNFRLPEITRGLLMYRYRRIGEARASAQRAGYRGAMYPWQSGSDGEEETQLIHINPLSGRWEPGFLPQPAPRQRRHLLQHLALLPDHSRRRFPTRSRRRDDARDRALLVLDRALQSRPRSLGDPRRHGSRRVPRKVSGRGRGRAAQQRVHERDGGLDLRHRAEGARPPAKEPTRRSARPDRPAGRRRSRGGARSAARCSSRSTRTASSASSRDTRTSRSSTGTAIARNTRTFSGSTGSSAPRATAPIATASASRRTR